MRALEKQFVDIVPFVQIQIFYCVNLNNLLKQSSNQYSTYIFTSIIFNLQSPLPYTIPALFFFTSPPTLFLTILPQSLFLLLQELTELSYLMPPQTDLYLILTPLFAFLTFLTILSLKLSLKRSVATNPNHLQKLRSEVTNDQQTKEEKSIFQTNLTLKIFAFFVKNQTILESCLTRKSKNKLPLFMILSLLAILSFAFPSVYFFCLIGAPLAFLFVLLESCFESNRANEGMQNHEENVNDFLQEVKQETENEQKKQYIYIAFGIISSGLFVTLAGLTFKNYFNSTLIPFLITFGLNAGLDLFIVRPILFLIISAPLTMNLRIQIHISEENLRSKLQNLTDKIDIKECAVSLSPRKKSTSPTKIPRVKRLEKENVKKQTLAVAMEVVKKVKKEKKVSLGLMTPLSRRNRVQDGEIPQQYSLYHLFDHEKSRQERQNQTPIAHFNFENNEDSLQQSGVKTKRKSSDLMIIELRNSKEEMDEEIREATQEEERKQMEEETKNGKLFKSKLDFDNVSEIKEERKEEIEVEEEQLKIIKLCHEKQNSELDEEENIKRRKPQEQNYFANKMGILCINETGEGKQIEEIDMNSPSKRNKLYEEKEIQDYVKRKSKGKHTNSHAKRRVIQFTSGEPYLQYLPKMLSKQINQHTKKSQPIAFKSEVQFLEEKPRKSLKKMRNRKEGRTSCINNENECPEAIYIEDL